MLHVPVGNYLWVIPIKQPVSVGWSQTQSLWVSLFPTAEDVQSTEHTFMKGNRGRLVVHSVQDVLIGLIYTFSTT